jgi:Protein of unknown function DUF262
MLKEEIDRAKRSVATDTVQMTIGEVANMYASSELNILPEFQRLFRWTEGRKSNFVESILIGIPIPPAFVYEKEDGTWELIDGLQRISTVLEFMGLLSSTLAIWRIPKEAQRLSRNDGGLAKLPIYRAFFLEMAKVELRTSKLSGQRHELRCHRRSGRPQDHAGTDDLDPGGWVHGGGKR